MNMIGLRSRVSSFLFGVTLASIILAGPSARADDAAPCVPVDASVTATEPSLDGPPAAAANDAAPATGEMPPADENASPPPPVPNVVFNELLPDPVGDDSAEFIELSDLDADDAALAGWRIEDGKGHSFVIGDVRVGGKAFTYFLYPESKIRLANTGGSLALVSPDGVTRDSVTYVSPVPEGKSYARIDGGWRWVSRPTPGEGNIADAPVISSAASSDVAAPPQVVLPPETTRNQAQFPLSPVFSALLPNPDGDDQGEWFELSNSSPETVDLLGWHVVDAGGASALLDGLSIGPSGTVRVTKEMSKLSLNNDAEELRLLDPTGSVRDDVSYENAPSGARYAKIGDEWRWREASGPASPAAAAETVATDAALQDPAAPSVDAAQDAEPVTLDGLGDADAGTPVTVTGTVTLPPGAIGKTILAVEDAGGENGLFLRLRGNGAPPELSRGDLVALTGKTTDGAYGLSVRPQDVAVRKKGGKAAVGERTLAELDQADEGLLVRVAGTVAGRGKRWLTLTDEAADIEARVTFVGGIAPPAKQGDQATVTGVARFKNGKTEIIVMGPSDVSVVPRAAETPVEQASSERPAQTSLPERRPALSLDTSAERPVAAFAALAATLAAGVAAYVLWKRGRFA